MPMFRRLLVVAGGLGAFGIALTAFLMVTPNRLDAAGGRILYFFQARDVHLVLGPGKDGKPVRFRVTIDGKAPGEDHGVDTDAAGNGVIDGQRLYQLVRLKKGPWQRLFGIEFLDPGVQAYSFTFG